MTKEYSLEKNQLENEAVVDVHGMGEIPMESTSVIATPHYAGFWMRFWAYLLDCVVIFSINGMLVKPVFRLLDISLSRVGIFSAYAIISGLVFYLYFILMTKYLGQTLGKMVFGLKVISLKTPGLSWGTVVFREGIGRFISVTLKFLYAIAAFTPKKQALHDMFADTAVIHDRM
ncbi:RDD family protein [Bacillus sp. FSL K6-3431]|uniref:RDD family protein n=1 Tax=Bacillus sp. FSL K6-3431 TaxID=2921500 RepID=UPI0040469C71